ncbi:hypothetical protein ADUPG1_011844 [Aduncisulcus paluster]|uniref:Uncharacterized protein n=1 Tax=Aduncisulcus paluster TaxID=2918883 RepID=A0ABQ5JXC3_9EUKA|nr:hypothetical protein ADUPG1_011844 [Aduncisulcus paluster]
MGKKTRIGSKIKKPKKTGIRINPAGLLENGIQALQEGDYASALSISEQAYKLAPKNVEIIDFYAELLIIGSEYLRARSLLLESMGLDKVGRNRATRLLSLSETYFGIEGAKYIEEAIKILKEKEGSDENKKMLSHAYFALAERYICGDKPFLSLKCLEMVEGVTFEKRVIFCNCLLNIFSKFHNKQLSSEEHGLFITLIKQESTLSSDSLSSEAVFSVIRDLAKKTYDDVDPVMQQILSGKEAEEMHGKFQILISFAKLLCEFCLHKECEVVVSVLLSYESDNEEILLIGRINCVMHQSHVDVESKEHKNAREAEFSYLVKEIEVLKANSLIKSDVWDMSVEEMTKRMSSLESGDFAKDEEED